MACYKLQLLSFSKLVASAKSSRPSILHSWRTFSNWSAVRSPYINKYYSFSAIGPIRIYQCSSWSSDKEININPISAFSLWYNIEIKIISIYNMSSPGNPTKGWAFPCHFLKPLQFFRFGILDTHHQGDMIFRSASTWRLHITIL